MTRRLLLRSFRDEDLDQLAALAANEGFRRFSGGGALDREQSAALLERIMIPTRANLPALFALSILRTDQLIGFCGFVRQEVDGIEELEIAYRLHPDFWGRGLATEAARAVRDHAFRDLTIRRVISLIHPDNHASRRVAEKNGMQLEKETLFKTFPTLLYAISRDDWMLAVSN